MNPPRGMIPEPAKRSAIRYFGDYVLLGEIARGGMGVVYRALQTSLDREVAIKMIDAGKLASEGAVHRFHTEAEAMAKLDHPNIVSIFEIGQHDGHHYFAMKLVDGSNLAEQIGDRPMETHAAVALLIIIARAVQYAHDRGVLHRDLKPSNILLDSEGKPHITDFGIAKLAERGAGFTGTVAMLGTPEYMAPEQAIGKASQAGTSADIYSLGAVLYHLLTGQPPFRGESPFQILDHVLKQAPASICSINPAVDSSLETICLKCLNKTPQNRYGSAKDLALGLEKWLTNRPIESGVMPRREQMGKWIQGHPAMLALSTLLLVVIGFGVASLSKSWNRMTQPPEQKVIPMVGVSTANTPTVAIGIANRPQSTKAPQPLTTNVVYLKTSSSGTVWERREKNSDEEQIQHFSFTGRLQRKEVLDSDGTKQDTYYDLNGQEKRQEILYKDGSRKIVTVTYDRNGQEHARDIIKLNAKGKAVDKTSVIQSNSVFPQTITNHFEQGQFGFVYRPEDIAKSLAALSWYDAYWHTPTGIPVIRPFRYSWSWKDTEWSRSFQYYWIPDNVYPTPAHWLADWLIACCLADDYAAETSATQLRKEARLARTEAETAKQMAGLAKNLSEANEAKVAEAKAELRAKTAEENAAKIEAEDVRPNNGTTSGRSMPRIGTQAKKDFSSQIETIIAAKINFARQATNGQTLSSPDLSDVLEYGGYMYLVSKTLSIVAATDRSPAGTLSAGDLLTLELGQHILLDEADENTFVVAKIISSKENEAAVGTSILISLRDLQAFDGEFRAKLNYGLIEAHKNDVLFRQGALK